MAMAIPQIPTYAHTCTYPPAQSSPINLHHRPDRPPTNGANLHLPGTLDAGTDVATIVKQRVLLALVADLTRALLLVRDEIVHGALAETFALPEAADVLVARGGVDHLAFAVHLVLRPFARVHVAVLVRHRADTRPVRGHDVAGVRVAVHVGRDAGPIGAAALQGAGKVVAGEVGLRDVAVDLVWVVRAEAEIVQVVGGIGKVAALLDQFGPVAGISFASQI